jgi:hypothetical protein
MPDPYREGDTPFFLDDTPYDEFEAFRHYWRGGASLDELYPDGPFALRGPVGPYKANRRGDVAKVQTLLHDTGYLNANETDGPTGLYSRVLLDEPIRRFQTDHGLKVDGLLNPDGETIGALQSLLGPHTGRNPFEALSDDPDAAPSPSVPTAKGVQVADESAAFARHAAGLGLAMGAVNEWRKKMEEIGRRRSAEPESSGPPPFPAAPPFAPGEMQSPGYPAKPPFDPEEFNKEEKPAEPIMVRGTVFPATPQNEPTVLIFPDLSEDFGRIFIVENRKGNPLTQTEVQTVHEYMNRHYPDYEWLGGGKRKEYWFAGPGAAFKDEQGRHGDGRPGGKWADLAYRRPDRSILVIQLVDVDKNGKPTKRELDNAEAIRRLSNAEQQIDVHLIPTLWQLRQLK